MTTPFPRPNRSQSCEEVLQAALAVFGALHEHLGGDRESRHLFCFAVARAILEITDQPHRKERMEANIVAHLVAERVTAGARAERAAERTAAEAEREKRKIVNLSQRVKAINTAFRRSSTGGRGPDEAA